jgi:hypothetical protein
MGTYTVIYFYGHLSFSNVWAADFETPACKYSFSADAAKKKKKVLLPTHFSKPTAHTVHCQKKINYLSAFFVYS